MSPQLSARLRALAVPAILALTALLAVSPEIVRGNSCGHDTDFHLVCWFDAHTSWQQGVFYPHWSPSASYETGEPRFVFYPPLTWMLGTALSFLVPWQWVAIALTWILLFGAGLAAYALARLGLPRRPATIAGSIALITSYSLFDAYERTAFGELAGGIWIPLLLLFILSDRNRDGSLLRRAFDGSTVWLAVAVAGAWLSDVPLGIIAAYLLAAVALGCALMRRTWAPIIRATLAVLLGLGVTGIYLLPAIAQQSAVSESQLTSDPSTHVENSWLFARHPSQPELGQYDHELLRVSAVGSAVIVTALVCFLVAWRRKRLPGPRSYWVTMALIPVVVLLLQLPISLPVWHLLPKLRFLQFPWRWFIILQAPLGIFFACAICIENQKWRRVSYIVLGLAMFTVTMAEIHFFFYACDPEDSTLSMRSDFVSRKGFVSYDEYAPPFANDALLAVNLPDSCLLSSPLTPLGLKQADDSPDDPPVWDASQKSCQAIYPIKYSGRPNAEHMQVDFDPPHASYLVIRVRSYPAWHIQLNGEVLRYLPKRKDGLIVVPVAAGHNQLRIDWNTSGTDIAARWLSLLSIAGLIALFMVERKRPPSHLS